MKNNKHFFQIPYGVIEKGISVGALGVYAVLKRKDNECCNEYGYFFMSNKELQEGTGIKKRDTLIKYKNELKQAGLIYELSRTHVIISPSGERLKKGFCTYFLPDTSESKEYNQEKLEQAIKDKGDLGIIARYMKC